MTQITNGTSVSNGITLSLGDVLTNTAAGTITAPQYAVYAAAGPVTVDNQGSIVSNTTSIAAGIRLAGGGTVTNESGGSIAGYAEGLDLSGASSTLTNAGVISADTASGIGALLGTGGTVDNQSGGSIGAEIGVYFRGQPGSLTNAGTISGNSAGGVGVLIAATGSVTNQSGGSITAQTGIFGVGAAVTVTNAGSIDGGGFGIHLLAGGAVTNQSGGSITGPQAVYVAAGGSVLNGGNIQGSGVGGLGVVLSAGGSVTNQSGGTIGGTYAVSFRNGAGTLENAGSISGQVRFAAGYADRLVIDPGASFGAQVDGGNTLGAAIASTLELAAGTGAGVLSGLGSQYIDFAQVTVDTGAAWTLSGDNTLASGATLDNAGTLTIAAGATLSVASVTGTGTITFAAGSGELQLTPGSFTDTIAGLQPGATLALTGITDALQATVLSGNTLEITRSGGAAIDLQLNPAEDFSTAQFHVSNIAGAAQVTDTVPCYLAGTRIRTPRGEMRVEDLHIGDDVITLGGQAKPIKWIGRRSYFGAVPAGLRDVIPIEIDAGALGACMPVRNLTLSPLHALYIDGVLVAAEHLVNGRTIRRRMDIDPIRYFHIELDSHDVIFADGAPAETFVDCDSRAMFHNAAEYTHLYPDDDGERWIFCAPRVEGGERLAAIRRTIDSRAGITTAPAAQPGPLLGHLDDVEAGRIAGWAFEPDHPGEPVWLEVLDGEGVIARVLAKQHRADLEEAGIGDGRHSFELNLRGRLAPGHLIHVRRCADGADLPGSPLLVPAAPADKLAQEVQRLVAAAVLDPPRGETLHSLGEALLQGMDRLRRTEARLAEPRRCEKQALIIDSLLPQPGRDGGSQAVLGHAAALRGLGFQVAFAGAQELTDSAGAAALRAEGYVVHAAPQVSSVEEVLRRYARSFDLVYLHRLDNAEAYLPLARRFQPRARLIYSVADLHHVRTARQAEVQASEELRDAAAVLHIRELSAMRLADAVITHSSAEADYLKRVAPSAAVHVVPWPATATEHDVPFAARAGVACIGSWSHTPNVDAVRWLAGSIMPLVWARAPHIELLVAGSGWPRRVPWIDDPRVRLLGALESLDPLLAMVRLTVAPLRFGAGLKSKVLDSLAAGVPCVMTPIAAEGFPMPDAAALVGETPRELAELILRAHEDGGVNRAAAQAGQAMVQAQFSADAVRSALKAALGPLAKRRPRVTAAA